MYKVKAENNDVLSEEKTMFDSLEMVANYKILENRVTNIFKKDVELYKNCWETHIDLLEDMYKETIKTLREMICE